MVSGGVFESSTNPRTRAAVAAKRWVLCRLVVIVLALSHGAVLQRQQIVVGSLASRGARITSAQCPTRRAAVVAKSWVLCRLVVIFSTLSHVVVLQLQQIALGSLASRGAAFRAHSASNVVLGDVLNTAT